MALYAKVEKGIVTEIISLSVKPEDAFHKDVADLIVSCGDEVDQQWTYESGVFSAPRHPFDVLGIEKTREQINKRVKRIAKVKILAIMPEWKQRNTTARLSELTSESLDRTLTDVEKAEIETNQSLWNQVKSIRNYSNSIELSLSDMPMDQLKTFDPHDDAHWS